MFKGGLGNSWSAKKSLSPSSSSISSSNEEQEKKEVSQVDVEDSEEEVEMDVEPSRMNKGKNTIMDLTTSRYVLCKKSKKNIDSSIPSMRSLSNPLPSTFVPSTQASLVPISSDVDLLNTRQGNISTDVSSSFMAFVGGSSRFMFFSPTTINKGKNTIMDLTMSRYDKTIPALIEGNYECFLWRRPSALDRQDRAVQLTFYAKKAQVC
ncbi:hypothetical protein NC653_033175 [Populus alba x Populus x berolinensis]|uniref:Uncharacterized protein n=1 Tax=Populus alba x Populus x berolinensis TaxID=444605 RepID=A0AAD6LT14_9ROSI|nr:hypothetical protein NC653_033175 [Populus alba x Populus x berolinensis]